MAARGIHRLALLAGLTIAPLEPALAQAPFDNAVLYNAGTTREAVAIGDLDGDQDVDLAVVDRGGHLQILFNGGSGAFSAPVAHNNVWPSSSYTVDVRLADLDRDDDEDVIAAFTSLGGAISILRNCP